MTGRPLHLLDLPAEDCPYRRRFAVLEDLVLPIVPCRVGSIEDMSPPCLGVPPRVAAYLSMSVLSNGILMWEKDCFCLARFRLDLYYIRYFFRFDPL